jgi:hypothetical protein
MINIALGTLCMAHPIHVDKLDSMPGTIWLSQAWLNSQAASR